MSGAFDGLALQPPISTKSIINVGANISASIFAGGIVNLSIGPDEIPFDAHIELLCAHSSFFDKALDGRFVEAETKYIPFPDEDPAIFTEFLSWAYTGQFTCT